MTIMKKTVIALILLSAIFLASCSLAELPISGALLPSDKGYSFDAAFGDWGGSFTREPGGIWAVEIFEPFGLAGITLKIEKDNVTAALGDISCAPNESFSGVAKGICETVEAAILREGMTFTKNGDTISGSGGGNITISASDGAFQSIALPSGETAEISNFEAKEYDPDDETVIG